MPPPGTDVLDLDTSEILATCHALVLRVCPGEPGLVARTLDALTPSRWTLEWYLPWWLGHAFDLRPEPSRQLVLANVLGLASIRLQDDLIDGDLAKEDLHLARRSSAALYDAALDVYASNFAAASPIWGFIEATMADWRAASAAAGPGRDPIDSDGRMLGGDLASRGAPLKIGAYAACLLADRTDRWRLIERCIDRALTAMVLYDHVSDWEADLEAGRWNAFVAAAVTASGAGDRPPSRTTILVAMLTRGVVAGHFDRIRAETLAAARIARCLPSPPLAACLDDYATTITEQGAMMEAHYRRMADNAANLIFGPGAQAGQGVDALLGR